MKEIDSKEFFPLKGYEGFYEINTNGDIRSVDRIITTKGYNGKGSYTSHQKGVPRRSFQNGSGYLQIKLYINGKEYREYVHRLVYDTFIGIKEKKSRRTYTYDEMEKVLERLKTEPMSKVCKDYGLSDKGLSKRLKSVGLPYQMKEIKKYFNNN